MEFLKDFLHAITTPEGLETLVRTGGYVVLCAIVFAETGLLIGFFLPGDSLLFIAGFVAAQGYLDIWLLNGLLCAAAVTGDTVGYWIGAKTGPKIFTREDSLLFRKAYILRAKAFYDRHGGKTIVMARFVPIIRTFAPVVAGVAQMEYRRFLAFNVFGGIGWVVSLSLAGYFLGSFDIVKNNLEKAVIGIIVVSVLPIAIGWFRERRAQRREDSRAGRDRRAGENP